MNRAVRILVHPLTVWAMLIVLCVAGLTTWFFARVDMNAAREQEAGRVVLQARTLADEVSRCCAREGSEDRLAALVREWGAQGTPPRQVRVVRLDGARLLASSFPDDLASPPPRRLATAEKPLFDLGQQLRAAAQANRAAGERREAELRFERIDAGRARVAVPFLADGAVAGFVQIQVPSRLAQLPGWLRAAPYVLGPALLVLFVSGLAYAARKTLIEYRHAYAYIAPAMIGMLILVFFPFIYGIVLSFTGQTILNVNQPITELWVGLQNYAGVLGDFGVAHHTAAGWEINYQNFYWTLWITAAWTVSNVTVGVTLGMILALALNTPGLRGKPIYRVLLILPWAMPNYITALIWRGLFHPQFGAINQAIQMFGGAPVAWFDGVFSSFMTGLAANGWLSFPFMMVVISGGLQSIAPSMYEAATVEGASRWQQLRHITLPLLKPTLVPAVVLSVVWTFNMFNVIYLVSGGAPAGANEILVTRSYKIAFEEYRYGYAAAYSVVIFLILLVYGVFQTRVTRATEAVHA